MNQRKNALLLSLLIIIPLVAIVAMVGEVKASPTRVYVDYYGKSEIYDITLLPGEQFTINITVDYVRELSAFQFLMVFNPEVLHGVKVENGPFLSSEGGTIIEYPGVGFDNDAGVLYLYVASLFPVDIKNPTGGGTLASVTFEVVGMGESPLTLLPETGLINKTGGWQFDGEWAYGWITVPVPPTVEERPYQPWRDSLSEGSGYFDNRPPVYVDPPLVKGVRKNNTFTVDIDVADMEDVYKWKFSMSWNATILNVTSVTEDDFLKGQPEGTSFFSEIHNDAGYLNASSSTVGSHPGVDGSGTLANVTFLVLEDKVASNLTLGGAYFFDSAPAEIHVRTANGFFTSLELHEITITDVTPNPDRVKEGSNETISINVTVENTGDYNETDIAVTIYYDDEIMGTQTIQLMTNSSFATARLSGNSTITLTFMWNTTGVHRGRYTLSVHAETEHVDDSYIYGLVVISAHDIAIVGVTTPVSNVFTGTNATIYVDIQNQGTENENFTVTAYYDGNEIDAVNMVDFGHGESERLEFKWDTTGVPQGEYTISANATVVEGEEETADNTLRLESKVNVIPYEEEPFPTELLIVVAVPVAIIGAATVFYVRRKRRPPEIPE